MVVVDSSALIPLARVGRLDLITGTFGDIQTTEDVRKEVLTGGQRGTASLSSFLESATVHGTHPEAEEVTSMEGIAVADASVILVADETEAILLANDKGLIAVAKSHGIECWWVTTLLLKSVKSGTTTSMEATDILYELVDEGMNLHPKVYSKVQKQLTRLGE